MEIEINSNDHKIFFFGPSVNACQTFSLTYRCTGVPKIVYMVTSQGVRVMYYP